MVGGLGGLLPTLLNYFQLHPTKTNLSFIFPIGIKLSLFFEYIYIKKLISFFDEEKLLFSTESEIRGVYSGG